MGVDESLDIIDAELGDEPIPREELGGDAPSEDEAFESDGLPEEEAILEGDEERVYVNETLKFYQDYENQISQNPSPTKVLDKPLVYYKKLLELVPSGQKFSEILNEYLNSTEADRSQFRDKTIIGYWNFLRDVITTRHEDFTEELSYAFRFGLVITSAVAPNILHKIKLSDLKEPDSISIFYLDEWLLRVAKNLISQTVVNETDLTAVGQHAKEQAKLEQLQLQKDRLIEICSSLNSDMNKTIEEVVHAAEVLRSREGTDFHFDGPYSNEQSTSMRNIKEALNQLSTYNESLEDRLSSINGLEASISKAQQNIKSLEDRIEQEKERGKNTELEFADKSLIAAEFNSIQQMLRATVGKRGNNFPILLGDFFSGPERSFGLRPRVAEAIKRVEAIDYTIFKRVNRGQSMRMFPQVLLGPCYATKGMCWEPFDPSNRSTSTAKFIIPMFTQDLEKAVIYAMGDFRWQYAKEKAGYNWLEEGLTGAFYYWHSDNIKKGDLKESFVDFYYSWIKWESNGAQRLDKELRFIFWKFAPFPEKLKLDLVQRSTVYATLYRKTKGKF